MRGIFCLLLAGCATSHECLSTKWGYAVGHNLQYPIGETDLSPAGVKVDASGQGMHLPTVDRLVAEVSDCLKMSIDRSAFLVKIPGDFVLSCDHKQQELTAIAPMSGCDAKNLAGPCQCHWRAIIQCPNVIVTTPSLYLFKDALVRWVTGSQNPWADPALAACAAPSTDPLSLGGGP
jgi:hypothetical protein